MNLIQGPFRWAVGFLLLSAALQFLTSALSGLSAEMLRLIPLGIACVLLAMGLARGWRWLAYLAFLATAVFGIYFLSFVWAPSVVPQVWFVAIIAANWLASGALLVALWKAPPSQNTGAHAKQSV